MPNNSPQVSPHFEVTQADHFITAQSLDGTQKFEFGEDDGQGVAENITYSPNHESEAVRGGTSGTRAHTRKLSAPTLGFDIPLSVADRFDKWCAQLPAADGAPDNAVVNMVIVKSPGGGIQTTDVIEKWLPRRTDSSRGEGEASLQSYEGNAKRIRYDVKDALQI